MKQQQSRNNYSWIFGHSVISMFFVALLLCTFSSCKDDNGLDIEIEEKTVTFSLDVSKGFTSPSTYALTTQDEDAVKTVEVLIFDTEGNYFSGPHYGIIAGDEVTLRVPDEDLTDYEIAVFANCRSIISSVDFETYTTKTTIFGQLIMDMGATKWNSTPGSDGYKPIPMYGTLDKDNNKAELTRMLARINVSTTALTYFSLESVHLVNYNTKGYVAKLDPSSTTPEIPTSAQSNKFADALHYNVVANVSDRDIYTFEAAAGSAGTLASNPCIIIGGTYDGMENNYYRIDFADKGTYLSINRNHSYNITVAEISGTGYATAEEAFTYAPANVEYDISSWDDKNITEANYNGQYMLGASTSKLTFDSSAKGSANGNNILFIQTDHPTGWSAAIEYKNGSGWLSLLDMSGSAVTRSADLKGSYAFSTTQASPVKLKLLKNEDGQDRTAVIKLTAGNIKYSVTVTQSKDAAVDDVFKAESSSYTFFTSPFNDNFFIPVSIANGGNTVQLNSGDSFTASVTGTGIKKVAPFGVGSDGHVYVEPGTEGGTATVSISKKNESGQDVLVHSWTMTVIKPVVEPQKSNCYIVKPNTGICFPATRANDSDLGILLNPGDAYAVELVWSDGPAANSNVQAIGSYDIEGNNAQVLVGTGAEAGNAVVGIRKKNATENDGFLWSWHIWVTDYNPGTPASGYFMDRNLGALNNGFVNNLIGGTLLSNEVERSKSMGLHYQWGRKDPFPTSTTGFNTTVTPYFGNSIYGSSGTQKILNVSSISSSTYPRVPGSSTDNNLGFTVSNPHIFYFSNSSPNDWYATSTANQNANLWGGDGWDGQGTPPANTQSKTVYDPCPPGWRVPSLSDWTVALNGKTGYMDSDTALGNGIDPSTGGWNWQTNGMIAAEGGSWVDNQIANTFFPASNSRYDYNGSLNYAGTDGFYWSASPRDRNARYLAFSSGILYAPGTASYTGRAAGSSVRCSKE